MGYFINGVSLQLTWQGFWKHAQENLTFTNEQKIQIAWLAVFIFIIYFIYHLQLYDWHTSVVRIPRKLLIAVWMSFIIGITLINRNDQNTTVVCLSLEPTYQKVMSGDTFSQYQVLSNVLLFIPYGFLLPWNIWYCRRWWITFLLCGFSSLLIEAEQRITGRGVFDVADLLTNVAGGMIGFIFYRIFELLKKLIRYITARRTEGKHEV